MSRKRKEKNRAIRSNKIIQRRKRLLQRSISEPAYTSPNKLFSVPIRCLDCGHQGHITPDQDFQQILILGCPRCKSNRIEKNNSSD